MRVLAAPDKFKGSLSAAEAAGAIARGVRAGWPGAEVIMLPLADGGEGTAEALVAATGGVMHRAQVTGPRGETVEARFGMMGSSLSDFKFENKTQTAREIHPSAPPGQAPPGAGENSWRQAGALTPRAGCPRHELGRDAQATGVLEMAEAAGLALVPEARRNPLFTTTYGVGELIRAAVGRGARRLLIGIGGSATNDCGCGMAQALGVRFWDRQGNEITKPLAGGDLGQVARVDGSGLNPEIRQCEFLVACDVSNPLLGPTGATYTYGPQKGAGEQEKRALEANLEHVIGLIEAATGRQVRQAPGAGAAGGLGAGLMAFLGARLERGIDLVLRQLNFEAAAAQADLVLTGEGRLDESTLFGKTIWGVAQAVRRVNSKIPVIALAGSVDLEILPKLANIGVTGWGICPGPVSLEEAIRNAGVYLESAAGQVMRIIKTTGG